MATHPYLHFQGDCAEALAFYVQVFDATDPQMLRYGDGPEAPTDWAESGRIMHGQLTIGDGTLMMSDFAPGTEGDPQKAVSVMQTAPDLATARKWYERLCEGGEVIMEFGEIFFSPGFGMVRDRFGTHWMIAAEQAEG